MINTTPNILSNVAIEVSIWDLNGDCPYYKVTEVLSVPCKRTIPVIEMEYPKSSNPKPVYFLLLKLYNVSDYSILSRNFYWLHLPGGDYKLLEPYRKKTVPLKITSRTVINGSSYEIRMHVENTSKKPETRNLLFKNNFVDSNGDKDFSMSSFETVQSRKEQQVNFLQRISRKFSVESDGLSTEEINGSETGVAFFLQFSVHASKKDLKEGEDTRILPVHYSDNYFSLVPGEVMPITLSFEVPSGVTPKVELRGWNYHATYTVQ